MENYQRASYNNLRFGVGISKVVVVVSVSKLDQLVLAYRDICVTLSPVPC